MARKSRHTTDGALQLGLAEIATPQVARAPLVAHEKNAALQMELIPPVDSDVDGPLVTGGGKSAVVSCIQAFDTAYRLAYAGERPTWGAKQAAMIKRLLASHGEAVVRERIESLFRDGPRVLRWISGKYDLGTLVAHFDKLGAAPAGRGMTAADLMRRAEELRRAEGGGDQ